MLRNRSNKRRSFKASFLYKNTRHVVRSAKPTTTHLPKARSLKTVNRTTAAVTPLLGVGYDLTPLVHRPAPIQPRPVLRRYATPKPNKPCFPSLEVLASCPQYSRRLPSVQCSSPRKRRPAVACVLTNSLAEAVVSDSSEDKLPTMLFQEYL